MRIILTTALLTFVLMVTSAFILERNYNNKEQKEYVLMRCEAVQLEGKIDFDCWKVEKEDL